MVRNCIRPKNAVGAVLGLLFFCCQQSCRDDSNGNVRSTGTSSQEPTAHRQQSSNPRSDTSPEPSTHPRPKRLYPHFSPETTDSSIVFEGVVNGLQWTAKDSPGAFVYYPKGKNRKGIPDISFTFYSAIPGNDWKIELTSHNLLEPGFARWPPKTFDVHLTGKFRDGIRHFALEDPPVEARLEITRGEDVGKRRFLVKGHFGCEVFDPEFRSAVWIDGDFRYVCVQVKL